MVRDGASRVVLLVTFSKLSVALLCIFYGVLLVCHLLFQFLSFLPLCLLTCLWCVFCLLSAFPLLMSA